ncbi:hypothetical protein [Streptomyces sp. NPDC058653]|uniref:hypothetical protein n=1 Tax=Streptomyces sp. NPDC058653 TaxID=3346576 RepID=UPI0036630319
MRTTATASAAVAGAAALILGAGSAAFADDVAEYDFSVSPETVAPGGEVTIGGSGCKAPTVTVSSGVFETVTLKDGEEKSARVFDDVKPEAEYEITFDCDGVIRSVPLMIKSGKAVATGKAVASDGAVEPDGVVEPGKGVVEPGKTGRPDRPGKPPGPPHSSAPLGSPEPLEPLLPARPKPRPHGSHDPDANSTDGAHKGVKAGVGGSTDGGPNTAGLAVGAAVIAVAVGGAVRLVRSRPVNGS